MAAIALRLDSPHWAAMTVWIVAQPTRGMLIGKCASRLVGTAIGVAACVALLQIVHFTPWAFIGAVTVWVAACAALANLLTGLRGYAAMLAGYTAPLVAMAALRHPEHAAALAGDRVSCIVVGVVASAALTWFVTPSGESGLLRERAERAASEAVRWVLAVLQAATYGELAAIERRLIADMADIDVQCDAGGSATLAGGRERRAVRELLGAVLTAMAAARALYAFRMRGAAGLDTFAAGLSGASPPTPRRLSALLAALQESAAPAPGRLVPPGHHVQRLRRALEVIADSLEGLSAPRPMPDRRYAPAGQPDWAHARRAGLRVFATLLPIGAAWVALPLPVLEGAFIGASILCSAFSAFDAPKTLILRAVEGTAAGTAAAAFYVLGVSPFVETTPGLLLAIAPFMFVGALALADRRAAMPGLDYSMIFLLLTAPGAAAAVDANAFLAAAPGPVLGALAAAAAFHFILPTDPARRLADLRALIVREARRLGDLGRPVTAERWRARASRRALQLTLRAELTGGDVGTAVRSAQASLNLGEDLLALRRLLAIPRPDDAAARNLLAELAESGRPVAALAQAFEEEAKRLVNAAVAGPLPVLLTGVAAGLALLPNEERSSKAPAHISQTPIG